MRHGGPCGTRVFAPRIRNPPSQARSGEFLKTVRWTVFLTEFHLIGSIPLPRTQNDAHRMMSVAVIKMERVTGIEPALSAWKAEVLPLNHTRICKDCWSGRQDLNLRHPAPKAGALPNCATSRLCSLVIISDYFNVSEIFFRNARRAFPRCDTLFFWACDTWASVSSPPNSSGTNSGS